MFQQISRSVSKNSSFINVLEQRIWMSIVHATKWRVSVKTTSYYSGQPLQQAHNITINTSDGEIQITRDHCKEDLKAKIGNNKNKVQHENTEENKKIKESGDKQLKRWMHVLCLGCVCDLLGSTWRGDKWIQHLFLHEGSISGYSMCFFMRGWSG